MNAEIIEWCNECNDWTEFESHQEEKVDTTGDKYVRVEREYSCARCNSRYYRTINYEVLDEHFTKMEE